MKANALMARASQILLDEDFTRWTVSELAQWISDAMREITLNDPGATSKNIVIPLVKGTFQQLPPSCHQLMRVVRNVDVEGDNRVGKGIITTVERALLDAQEPNWHDDAYVRFKPYAKHLIYDETDNQTFYVWPGNDGTGNIEAVVSVIPAPVEPDTGADPELIASYNKELDISDIYSNIVLDYTLYRAYCKDMQNAGAATRAQLYYQQFANALGIKGQSELVNSPNYKQTGKVAS